MYKIIRVVKFLKQSWTFLVIVSTVVVLCAGCKLDYKDADLAEEMNEQVPNSVLEDFSQVVVRDGKVSYTFSADHAELFDSTKLTYFDNIGFTEYKADGSTGTEGAAERAIHDSKTDNIIFDGKIILNATAQDFVVKSDYLEWNNEAKILKSLDDTEVSIEQGDGSVVKGRGFVADAKGKSFTFLEEASGRFIEDEETE
jgi:LPS export ABC transporter protein LptC